MGHDFVRPPLARLVLVVKQSHAILDALVHEHGVGDPPHVQRPHGDAAVDALHEQVDDGTGTAQYARHQEPDVVRMERADRPPMIRASLVRAPGHKPPVKRHRQEFGPVAQRVVDGLQARLVESVQLLVDNQMFVHG